MEKNSEAVKAVKKKLAGVVYLPKVDTTKPDAIQLHTSSAIESLLLKPLAPTKMLWLLKKIRPGNFSLESPLLLESAAG